MYLQLQGLRGQAETVKESVIGLLKPLATEITKTVDQSFQKLTSTYTEQLGDIKKESEEYAKRLGEAKFLEEEVKLARVISAIIKHPAEAQEFSLDYVLLLLEAVEKLCWAKGFNPKIKLKTAGITDDPLCSEKDVHVRELIYAAKTALFRGYVHVGA
jgi:hypothetical protein